jgi:two-component system response regulator NreC
VTGRPAALAGGARPPGLTTGPITLVLAEDHALVRAGLRMLLEAEPGFAVVGEAGDIATTERQVATQRPAVLVLDFDLSDGSSITAIPRLREGSPDTRIVILTTDTDPGRAREALQAGATGYVPKAAAPAELIHAVRLAAAGRTYLHPELGAQLIGPLPARAGATDGLTEREVEVLRLIALGHTNGEIATQLFLSVRTVESHRAHIQHKTGCGSRAELVSYARAHGLA